MLALLAVALVAYPLLAPAREEEEDLDPPEELDELRRRQESTYSAIKELEFDYRTGKLSEKDFYELDARYRMDALELMDAIEAWQEDGGGAPPEAQHDEAQDGEVHDADARDAGADAADAIDAEAEPIVYDDDAEADAEAECGECGDVVSPDHRFCASCGAEAVA
ncbi:MAG: hypothetical protein ACYCX3_02020 [Thermoleophilia bacterium]